MKQPYDIEKLNVMTWLRFPLILGVVLVHCDLYNLVTSWEGTAPEWTGWLIFIFHKLFLTLSPPMVPALFIISGYLFFRSQTPRNKAFFLYKYRRRIHSLLIPYLAWNTIAIIISVIRFNIIGDENYTTTDYLSGFWDFIPREGGDPADGPLWYMRDLMVVSFASPLFYMFLKKKTTGFIFLAFVILLNALNITIPAPGFSNTSIVFFSVGAYLALHDIDFTNIPKAIGTTAIILYIPVQTMFNDMNGNSEYIHAAYLFTVAITMTAAFYIVSLLNRKKALPNNPILTRLGFLLYALHGIIVGPIIKILYTLSGHSDSPIVLLGIFIITPITIIAITLVLYNMLTKFTPRIAKIVTGNRS